MPEYFFAGFYVQVQVVGLYGSILGYDFAGHQMCIGPFELRRHIRYEGKHDIGIALYIGSMRVAGLIKIKDHMPALQHLAGDLQVSAT